FGRPGGGRAAACVAAATRSVAPGIPTETVGTRKGQREWDRRPAGLHGGPVPTRVPPPERPGTSGSAAAAVRPSCAPPPRAGSPAPARPATPARPRPHPALLAAARG